MSKEETAAKNALTLLVQYGMGAIGEEPASQKVRRIIDNYTIIYDYITNKTKEK